LRLEEAHHLGLDLVGAILGGGEIVGLQIVRDHRVAAIIGAQLAAVASISYPAGAPAASGADAGSTSVFAFTADS
jgi:hypothetical protein